VPRDVWTASKKKKKASTTRRLDMATKTPHALLVCPSAQYQANQGLGGDALGVLVCPQPPAPMPGRPSTRGSNSRGLASRLTLLPSSPITLLLNSVVYSDSQYIHNAAQCTSFIMNSFTINSILCYIEILISFSYN
jgi:hypothetical protein